LLFFAINYTFPFHKNIYVFYVPLFTATLISKFIIVLCGKHAVADAHIRLLTLHLRLTSRVEQTRFMFFVCRRLSFSVRPENEVTQQAAYQTSTKSKIWDVCVKEGSQELRS
jgi:hypothetical protein